jgi:hypothetical protein
MLIKATTLLANIVTQIYMARLCARNLKLRNPLCKICKTEGCSFLLIPQKLFKNVNLF